jgi:hypothetical protein
MADKTLSTSDKLRQWRDARSTFNLSEPHESQPARNPNALYQYNEQVADVQGAVVTQANGTISFMAIHTIGHADPTRDVEYQDWVLSCPDLPHPRPNVIVGTFTGMVTGEVCRIIGKRS